MQNHEIPGAKSLQELEARSQQEADASIPGLAVRRAAVTLLHGVTAMGRALDSQLERILRDLPTSDRALARALVGGALRNLTGLDELIDSACQRPLPADARARMVLRIALTGRLLLETPAHAAIATALPMLEGGPRRLVHGVLSTLFRQNSALPKPRLPDAWADRWDESWGPEMVDAAAERLAEIPPTDLCLKDPSKTAEWMEKLGATSLMPGHLRLEGSHAVERLEGFAEGEWWVQDIAASLPARLMGDVRGLNVLDLCAAPGGKTMQLASMGAKVTALDINGSRLKRLKANLKRTGLTAEVIEEDARFYQPNSPFDAILLDAPCSATGTFRRHPDLLYLKANLNLQSLLALQSDLLQRAHSWLKPGGRLVYAVCSLEPAEGERASPPAGLVADPVSGHELPEGLEPTSDGAVRTLPFNWGGQGGSDGFFIRRFVAA